MSLQDLIILQDKCEELEQKLADSENKLKIANNEWLAYSQANKILAYKLEIAVKALERISKYRGITARYLDIAHIALKEIEKDKK